MGHETDYFFSFHPLSFTLQTSLVKKLRLSFSRRQNAEQFLPEIQAGFKCFLGCPISLNLLPESQDKSARTRSNLTSLKEYAVEQEITEKLRRILVWLALNHSAQPPQGKTRSPDGISEGCVQPTMVFEKVPSP